jgi:glycerophosphoryl diester phosphodiesterase
VPNRPPTIGAAGSAAPLVVAHRAGNHLDLLRRSEAAGFPFVEADVHLFRGRLEVRHLKTVGPLPIYWDRWALAAPWRPRLLLEELLAAANPTTELMIDLKGHRRRLAEHVAEALTPYLGTRRLTVSARSWPLLEVFEGLPVRRLHSVGTAQQLRTLLQRFAGARLDGVSIHARLLDAATVEELRRIFGVVMTWPVNDPRHAAELLRMGVDGLISDRPGELALAPEAAA